jgi:hypothetical protein
MTVTEILVGIGAGLAAALLFMSPIGGTLLAFPLFILSGFPIAIAGFAWRPASAYVAVASAGIAMVALLSPMAAAIFLLLFGLPTAWLCRLASLSRTNQATGSFEWYPLGRLLLHAALAASASVVLVGALIGFDPDQLTSEMSDALVEWLASAPDLGAPPTGADIEPFVRLNVTVLPFSAAALTLLALVLALWLGGKVAAYSGKLQRPRERLWTAALPQGVTIGFVAVAALSFVPGPFGQVASVFAGALGFALMLIGLSVIHVITLGTGARVPILVGTYVAIVFLGFPILLLILLGASETFFHFRARRLRGAPPQA